MYIMKRLSIFAALLVIALACQKEPVVPTSAVDTLPFPPEAGKDVTVNPGDNFWQYCNGTWDKNTPTPATGAVGTLYSAFPAMDQRVEEIVAEDPSLKRYFQLMDQLYANADEAMKYYSALRASYSTPQTREEVFKTVGRLIVDGMPFIGISLYNDLKDGKLIGVLGITHLAYKYSFAQMEPSVQAMVRLIAEGMEMDPETLYLQEGAYNALANLQNVPTEQLATVLEIAFKQWSAYISAETNEAGNNWKPEYTRAMARYHVCYQLSYRLAQKYVTPELKQYYLDMSKRLIESFRGRLHQLDWMSETTRANALEKLDKMMYFAGSPDTWYPECMPDLSQCKSLMEAVHKLCKANVLLHKKLIGTTDALSDAITFIRIDENNLPFANDLAFVNAYYSREYNAFVILPAMMLPPVTKPEASEAFAYGAIVIAAHEITHGFDSEGAKYDGDGRLRNWWTVADNMAFKDRQQKLIQCFNTLEYDPFNFPGQFGNGERTLTENIADLGGFLITLDAYLKRLDEQGFTGENRTAQLKKYYESFAYIWCAKYGPDKLQLILNNDIHSHARLRVNGTVMNTDMWYNLYDVTRNNILYLPPERRTYIW